MHSVSYDIIGLIPFIPAFSTITVRIGINSYFVAVDFNGAKGIIDFGRQFTGINSMDNGILKAARFIKMVEKIYQDIHQLLEFQVTPEMT
jgi:hypothetical protein